MLQGLTGGITAVPRWRGALLLRPGHKAPAVCRNRTFVVRAGALGPEPRARRPPPLPAAAELPAGTFDHQTNEPGENTRNEETRAMQFQAFRMPPLTSGIIGNSRLAKRLRRDVVEAGRDKTRRPVLIFGEPGLEKDRVASIVHAAGGTRANPILRVDCGRFSDASGSQLQRLLFGHRHRTGLLRYVGSGTLVLTNAHQIPDAALPRIVALLEDPRAADPAGADGTDRARVVMTCEKRVPKLEAHATVIKVPSLRARSKDVVNLIIYILKCLAKHGTEATITSEAVCRLQSYPYPNNIRELETIIERAIAKVQERSKGKPGPVELTPDVFWFASEDKKRFRADLLVLFPALRRFLQSDWWPRGFNNQIVAPVYAAVLALLFFGPQDRDHNFALNLFWCWWWPGIFIVYPFLGRIWCSVCPFMVYGELTQQLVEKSGGKLRKWPNKDSVSKWSPWFLLAFFYAILVWEECWGLNDTAYLSGWLLVIMTAGAMVCSAVFERRFWCRYLCPIGGMNAVFSKLSMTEIRSRQGICSGTCTTYNCFKGGSSVVPNGIQTNGCPLYSHPAQLQDNHNCVLCMDCIKTCPNLSAQFNLRPPAADLWQGHEVNFAEVGLMFMLLGAVYLHCLPELCSQIGISPFHVTDNLMTHMGVSFLLLSLPGVAIWLSDVAFMKYVALMGQTRKEAETPWVELAYGWLPAVWASTLAYYLPFLMQEGGNLLPVTAATAGFEDAGLPEFATDTSVVLFSQGLLLTAGACISGIVTWRLGRPMSARIIFQSAMIGAVTAQLWELMTG